MKFGEGNPGKPKGAVNKTTKLVKEVFADAFATMQEDAANNLVAWGKENPTEFYKLASKLIPVTMDGQINSNVNLLSIDPISNDSSNDSTEEDSGIAQTD